MALDTVSPAPVQLAGPPGPGPLRRCLVGARHAWRVLTSMRTALVLLFLLALAAIPGALLPQRSLNAQKVQRYIADRPVLGRWFDRLQLFDVFGSVWFTAVYVLLFVSLLGCVVPRVADHYRSVRTPPVRTPRNLSRLPHYWSTTSDMPAAEVVATAGARLRGWRVVTRADDGRAGAVSLSAEKGYLREFGNLVFHLALVGLLVAVAVGKLCGYEGQVVVLADGGPGVCSSSPAAFDSFRAGNLIDGTGLTPLCVRVKDFRADYLPNGQAQMFTATIAYQSGADLAANSWRDTTIRVNHPLRVHGDRVYLQGHGYAPTFTVHYPDGRIRTETVQWRPDDATTFLSSGAVRFDPPRGMFATQAQRRANQIAVAGLFAPTALLQGGLLTSSYPALTQPAVAVDIYRGDTGLDTGRAQSLFALDPDMIRQGRLVKQLRVNLSVGQSATLSDGTRVSFDGAQQFANLQLSHDPAQPVVLGCAVTMMAGLLVSLLVKRRRVWIRAYPDVDEAGQRRTVVDMGGLARTDQAGWGEEFQRLRVRLLGDSRTPTTTGA